MFSSNQIFDISCEPGDLASVIRFGISLYGSDMFNRADGRVRMAFSEPVPGKIYALGDGSMPKPYMTGPNKGFAAKAGRGWTDYPFDYDPEIIAKIIIQWLKENPPDRTLCPMTDGTVHPGIRVQSWESAWDSADGNSISLNRIRDWSWMNAILILSPCWMSYDK